MKVTNLRVFLFLIFVNSAVEYELQELKRSSENSLRDKETVIASLKEEVNFSFAVLSIMSKALELCCS